MMAAQARLDRGTVAVELTLFTPLLVLVLLLLVAAARLVSAREKVNDAAHQAARSASIVTSPRTAAAVAVSTAHRAITAGGVACQRLEVSTDTTGFHPGGSVTVQLTCTVTLSDLALLAVPGTRAISARFTAPIDRWVGWP
ncbi:pilus assembly protein [Actinomadura darangshiensis]|uniref:Pilus assembly protein n=1 Tax=Actinomadura darangshiensis TaxID=705336 RepID=A0A4R5A972_9ACTN|nr:TadE/TadG family type IV pilus assembly protein [Actinomadura darangshiensis]TDD67234.1 pilus assembly protein [Actinomadura darangshiensis]